MGAGVGLLLHSLDVLITPLSMAPVLAFGIEGQWDGVLEVEGCGLLSGVSSPKWAETIRRVNVSLVNVVRYSRGYEIF